MISDRDIRKIRARLLEQQQELISLQQAGENAAGTVELDPSRVGRLSRMDALQGQAMSQERERRRDRELRAIAKALARIESGDYGHCEECDDEIPLQRLLHYPSATLCIECASRKESS